MNNDDPSTCPPDAEVVPRGTIEDHAAKNCDDLKRKLANGTVAPTSVHDINCITTLSKEAVDSDSHRAEKGNVLVSPAIAPAMKAGGESGFK
jgi:hypothetical protein